MTSHVDRWQPTLLTSLQAREGECGPLVMVGPSWCPVPEGNGIESDMIGKRFAVMLPSNTLLEANGHFQLKLSGPSPAQNVSAVRVAGAKSGWRS